MSKIVFRNYDTKAIKNVLKEAGKKHYYRALKEEGIEQKPLTMTGFFIEYETDSGNLKLYHRYPSNTTLFIMHVLGYWAIPKDNWQMFRKDE